MKSVALELAPYGVRVNATLPTIIVSPFNDHPTMWARVAGRKDATREEWIDSMRSFHALRGPQRPACIRRRRCHRMARLR